jgi:hypothetical protein
MSVVVAHIRITDTMSKREIINIRDIEIIELVLTVDHDDSNHPLACASVTDICDRY